MLTSTYELGMVDKGCVEMSDRTGFMQIDSMNNSSNVNLNIECKGKLFIENFMLGGKWKHFDEESIIGGERILLCHLICIIDVFLPN